ncbi:hypothetical protein IFM89_008965 [Coptis chinensis]|uniref:Uncharacterized protein n=1 Tax=Coptis chinensis TaxID=261450 RepID=A0A835HUP2_9MAGN|nr:hypothetical protein IFM89_008965 [Coptis chinensis]
MKDESVIAICPSFSSYTSNHFAEIASKVTKEFNDRRQDFGLQSVSPSKDRKQDSSDETNNGFEFNSFCTSHERLTVSADEIFFNGLIRPIYPILNRDLSFHHQVVVKKSLSRRCPLKQLLHEERDSELESETNEAMPGTFCIWTPKCDQMEKCKKSSSTGTAKRWRLRDLIHKTNSEGKENLVFLARSPTLSKSKKKRDNVKVTDSAGVDEVVKSAHEIHYMTNRALKEKDRHRSYLPYRKDLIGFFANVNGLSRNVSPF